MATKQARAEFVRRNVDVHHQAIKVAPQAFRAMKTLSPTLRRQLERAVADARDVAEAGSRAALEALAVHNREPYGHMDAEQRALRRRLRAHARQLGDRRDARSETQAIDRLAHECAYEHWHGMLFARFLAENRLLMEPDLGVAVTLEECEELAKDEGIDKWALAARFAQRMLPQVFRPDHPVFEVRLAREHRLKLEGLVENLPLEVFMATDSLGWVYQFWQSRKKTEVNRSGAKIGADELPAVTQLFTEPYMVSFLLDNALGAWWAAHRLSASDLQTADTEAELRRKASIPGVPLDYLRFVRREHRAGKGGWSPAAGAFDGWPEHLGELKFLDPCCGSGHFLVAAFAMLVPMRMEREGLAAREAVDAVLRENLHGLEIDLRCVELAAFALAFAAWTWPGAVGYRPLPELNLACSGLVPNASETDWSALADQAVAASGMAQERDLCDVKDTLPARLRGSLKSLHELFGQASLLGSLIDPHALEADLFHSDYESVQTLFAAALKQERNSDDQAERAVAAQGMAKAAELLAGRYHLVITNVPYLARGKQNKRLRDFCAQRFPTAKNDLATVFLERCLGFCAEGGSASLVLPQNWLFLTSYRKLREKLLKGETWHLLARLGPKGFRTPMWDFNVQLLTLNRAHPTGQSAIPVHRLREAPSSRPPSAEVLKRDKAGEVPTPSGDVLADSGSPADQPGDRFSQAVSGMMYGLDVSESRTAAEKAARLAEAEISGVEQARQLENPDARVTLDMSYDIALLSDFADGVHGFGSKDSPRFFRKFWEIVEFADDWQFLQTTVDTTYPWLGCEQIVYWQRGLGILAERGRVGLAVPAGGMAWGKVGVAISQMRTIPCALYTGEMFDKNVAVASPKEKYHLPAIWCFCSSPEYHKAVRRIDQSLKVTNATLVQVPFDLDHWTRIANERYLHGLPYPYSDDPTQWIFHGHPSGSVVWDKAAKRTAHGPYRTDPSVLQIAVARLIGYRWPAEQDADMELAGEQREWVRRCEALLEYVDEDGIVSIPAVRGEPSAAERLLLLLAAAYGDAWSEGVLAELLAEVGSPSLDDWLRHRFFEQHCKLFHHRPFIWHIWDGRRDGFHALVNYHKIAEGAGKGRRLLESLAYSYLGDWIARQQDGVKRGDGGAEDRLAAAVELQKRLAAILQGEPPYDLFIRWKPIDEQPIGWEPGIDDGMRLNIRPFMAEGLPGGKKGAGILRFKPNIHWRKDRGREPEPLRDSECFPWFWYTGKFTGERVNDIHFTTAEKSAIHDPAGANDHD